MAAAVAKAAAAELVAEAAAEAAGIYSRINKPTFFYGFQIPITMSC